MALDDPTGDDWVTIRIKETTRRDLRELLGIGVTYDAVIANLLAFREEHVGADSTPKRGN